MRVKSVATVVGAVVIVLLWAGVAGAHVTVSPASLPQGTADAILTFRVPNESIVSPVTGLRVQFPIAHPIVVLTPEAGSGWRVNVQTARLAKPITTDDGTFTSTVSEIDWTGGTIPIGQFGEFNVLAQGFPSGTNRLVFKAVQQYGDGTIVSWIQIPDRAAPNPAHPAPVLTLTAKGQGGPSNPGGNSATATAGAGTGSSGSDHWLAVLALIVAGFAVIVAVLGVWLGRPRLISAAPPDDEDTTEQTTG